VAPRNARLLTISEWRESSAKFFWNTPAGNRKPNPSLKSRVDRMRNNEFQFFYGQYISIPKDDDWLTNPLTGYRYSKHTHWTKISTFNKVHGDIKYVWERSRFCFLYDMIRYDYHYQQDQSDWVFGKISDWIDSNVLNCGPNYVCSQEIALRCLNWLFALNYYRKSKNLNDELFSKIIHNIYWQISHVYSNINFSRIAVRNNHTLTETLALYVFGIMFPQFPEASTWKKNGKKWFCEELEYQIYPDGTFLQYSMNYNRVVVQLITWAIALARANQDNLDQIVSIKASKTLEFLLANLDGSTGNLPNYGANDGALFFRLSDSSFRDYRPQLNALSYLLSGTAIFEDSNSVEELEWYGFKDFPTKDYEPTIGIRKFDDGGYYTYRDEDSLTFIRCGNHLNRPQQADNLHLDLWYKGSNIMRDAGSYQYNTKTKWRDFFSGSRSHNTVMIENQDQMKRGPHFIWLNWSQCEMAEAYEDKDRFEFKGAIKAFQQLGHSIIHNRKVTKIKEEPRWIIEDSIQSPVSVNMSQIWNPGPDFDDEFDIIAMDNQSNRIEPLTVDGWYSDTYGCKEKGIQFMFNSSGNYVHTEIRTKKKSP